MDQSLIARLVEVYCLESDIEFSEVGSWTIKERPKQRGAEPDACYVFGPHEHASRPDLAEIAALIDRPTTSRAMREYRAALRKRAR